MLLDEMFTRIFPLHIMSRGGGEVGYYVRPASGMLVV